MVTCDTVPGLGLQESSVCGHWVWRHSCHPFLSSDRMDFSRANQSPSSWEVQSYDIRELPNLNLRDELGIWRKTVIHMETISSLTERHMWRVLTCRRRLSCG